MFHATTTKNQIIDLPYFKFNFFNCLSITIELHFTTVIVLDFFNKIKTPKKTHAQNVKHKPGGAFDRLYSGLLKRESQALPPFVLFAADPDARGRGSGEESGDTLLRGADSGDTLLRGADSGRFFTSLLGLPDGESLRPLLKCWAIALGLLAIMLGLPDGESLRPLFKCWAIALGLLAIMPGLVGWGWGLNSAVERLLEAACEEGGRLSKEEGELGLCGLALEEPSFLCWVEAAGGLWRLESLADGATL